MTKVSVITPVYNQDKFIQDAVDSVLNQTYKDFEIIVINDGSTDKTEEILREYGDKIRWKSQENQGHAVARNSGISVAKGEYFAFLDADDMCMPDRLELQVDYLDKHPAVGLVYTDYYQIDEEGEITKLISWSGNGALLIQQNYVPGSSCMCRSECLDTVGVFDADTLGSCDWDMWIRISERYPMHRIPKPLFKYRIHSKNTSLRPNRMDYDRKLQIMILEKAYDRRGKPFWLKAKIIRAKVERQIERLYPFSDNRYDVFFWACVDSVLDQVERVIFRLRERLDE